MIDAIRIVQNYIQYFLKILLIALKSKKKFMFPKNNKILIFDSMGSDKILDCIKFKSRPSVVDVRYSKINIPILLFSLFNSKYKNYRYLSTYIKYVNPVFIISYIDTSSRMPTIKKYFTKTIFIFIQNGNRQKRWLNDAFRGKYIDYYFTHQQDWKNFAKKYLKSNYVITGSIINNNYRKASFKKVKKIVWISQFRQKTLEYEFHILKCILPILYSYCKKNNIILEILSASKKNFYNEKKYYSKIIKNFIFIENNYKYKIYEYIEGDCIIAGLDSTFLREGFARGFRTAFFSVRNQYIDDTSWNFGWPSQYNNYGNFWTNFIDENIIINILNYLNNITKNEIESNLIKYKNIMLYDYNNTIIKDEFLKIGIEIT